MRSATQLLRSMGISKRTSWIEPSAAIRCRAAGLPLTTTSTATSRVPGIRACSAVQYGRRMGSGLAAGACDGSRQAQRAVTETREDAPRATSRPPPTLTPSAVKSSRCPKPSDT
jgi:hypothetical protein